METKKRIEELEKIFEEIDPKQRAVVNPLLPEIAYMEKEMRELRDLPHIRVHQKDKSRQQITAAGKRYRELMQTYTNAIKTLLSVLQRNGSDDGDELLNMLQEFKKQ